MAKQATAHAEPRFPPWRYVSLATSLLISAVVINMISPMGVVRAQGKQIAQEPIKTGSAELDRILVDLRTKPSSSTFQRLMRTRLLEKEHSDIVRRELANVLKRDDYAAKVLAFEALGKLGTANEVPLLLEFVEGNDPLLKQHAIGAVCQLKDSRAIKPVAKCLVDPRNRDEAFRGLRMFGKAAEPEVIPHLSSTDLDLVSKAMMFLGTDQSIPHLQMIADGQHTLLAAKASFVIRNIRNEWRIRSDVPKATNNSGAADLPKRTGNKEIDRYLGELESYLAEGVGGLLGMPVVEEHRAIVGRKLGVLLTRRDEYYYAIGVEPMAIEALGKWGTANEVPLLLDYINNAGDHALKCFAIRAACNLNDPRAIEPVANCLVCANTRAVAARGLRGFGPAAEPAVIPHLSSKNLDEVSIAVSFLRDFGTQKSVPHLEAVMNECESLAGPASVAIQDINRRAQK